MQSVEFTECPVSLQRKKKTGQMENTSKCLFLSMNCKGKQGNSCRMYPCRGCTTLGEMYPKQKTPSVSLGGADLPWDCNGALLGVS